MRLRATASAAASATASPTASASASATESTIGSAAASPIASATTHFQYVFNQNIRLTARLLLAWPDDNFSIDQS